MEKLGQLKNLKVLSLHGRSYMGKTMKCSRGSFLKLQVLKLWMLEELEKWEVKEGAMPAVEEVEIRFCVEAAEDFNSEDKMVRTFTGIRPPRDEMDEQEDTQLSEPGLNNYRTMPRNLVVGGAEQDQLSGTDDERTPTGDAQPAAVVAARNSPTLSNIVVPTRPRGSGKLNIEPSSSKHSEELMSKNADLERQLRDVQKFIDELKSLRSHQQTLDLDSAPLNLSITAEPYQEGFKIPHLETYDGSGDPDKHLHTYQAIMRIQNANDAMMCKVFQATLKSMARRCDRADASSSERRGIFEELHAAIQQSHFRH
ncbi:hypothetical protein SLEP1_g25676 [Rubroshorea leprosula]|uniref:Uncharacterized protein n=1 Tax=Rubroshorea leprosula TaxID=152421 RepID=A0AAV5JRY6_9ROSI|nr:hypothetical protein SLEP1_g25676 [Rubroshorea leprosula]